MASLKRIQKRSAFNKELFFFEKSSYLKNGISLIETLRLSESPEEKLLAGYLQDGHTLCEAMTTMDLFKERELHLIHLAEETGDLADTFDRIAQILKEERVLKEKVIGILIYPTLLLLATVVFFIGALYYILPPLKEMLSTLEVENKVLSVLYEFQLMIPMSVVVAVFFILSFLMFKFLQHKKIFRFLVFGKMTEEHEEMLFINELYLLLKGGVNLLEAFQLLETEERSCDILMEGIKEGKTLTESMRDGGYSKLLLRYLQISEETGNMEESLQAYLLVRKTYFEEYLKRRTALLEPLSIFVLGIVLFVLSLTVMMPMMDAYEKL